MGLNSGSCRVTRDVFVSRTKMRIEDIVDDKAKITYDGNEITIHSVDPSVIKPVAQWAKKINKDLKYRLKFTMGIESYPDYIQGEKDMTKGVTRITLNNASIYAVVVSRFNDYAKKAGKHDGLHELVDEDTVKRYKEAQKQKNDNVNKTKEQAKKPQNSAPLKEELHKESNKAYGDDAPKTNNTRVFKTSLNGNESKEELMKIAKAKAEYFSQVKSFMLHLQRQVEVWREVVKNKRHVSQVAINALRDAEMLYAKYKILWFGDEKTMKDMSENEFVAMIHEELSLLEDEIKKGGDKGAILSRMNYLGMLIKGKGIDGQTLNTSFNDMYNSVIDDMRKRYDDLEEQVTKEMIKVLMKEFNNMPQIKKMLNGEDIKTVEQLLDLIKAKGDLSYMEKLFKGMGFSDDNVGLLPEFLKIKLHQVQAKHLAEANKLKEKLYDADAKVGKDKSFAKEKDENGNLTGHLVQLFRSSWRDILQTAGRGAAKVAAYARFAERIDYTKIPELHAMFSGAFPEHFNKSTKEQEAYKKYLMDKLGDEYYNLVERSKKKLREYNNLMLISKEKSDKFNPFGEHIGEDETDYMEWIPKLERHYNKEWNKLSKDQKDYINTIKEINRYRFASGVEDQLETTYGKAIVGTLEVMRRAKSGGHAAKKLIRAVFKFFFKTNMYSDKHGVNSNYADTLEKFKRETYKYLSKLSKKELYAWAKQKGVTIPRGVTEKKEITNLIANALYSTELEDNITDVTEIMLDMAADTAMRNEMLPIARNATMQFRKYNYSAKNTLDQMQKFLNNVVKNMKEPDAKIFNKILSSNIDVDKIDSLDQLKDITLKGKDMQEHEKEFVDMLKKAADVDIAKTSVKFSDEDGLAYENEIKDNGQTKFYKDGKEITKQEFEKEYAKHIARKINATGIPLTVGSIFRGMNALILYKYLGLNPINGMVNRWQGLRDNKLADDSGWYWTTGNLAKSTRFLNCFNILTDNKRVFGIRDRLEKMKFLRNIISKKRQEEMDKIMTFGKAIGLDMFRNMEGGVGSFLMNWSILAPDGKNQLEILLSIMQDIKIKDMAGREHQLFNGEELVPFELVDKGNGRYTLRLKAEFATEENITMLEDFQEHNGKNVIADLVAKHYRAVSHIQNNFDGLDTAATTSNIIINSIATLKRWMVSGYMQRYDKGGTYNLTFNKVNRKGRYIVAAERPGAGIPFLLAQIGLTMGLGSMSIFGGGVMAGLVLYRLYKTYWKKSTNEQIKMQRDNLHECLLFMKYMALGAADFPVTLFTMGKKSIVNKEAIATQYLTADEVAAIKALGREVGIQTAMLAVSYMVLASLHGDDDDDDIRKKRFYNYMANRLTTVISDNQVYLNPAQGVESISRVGIIDYTTNIFKVLNLHNMNDQQRDNLYAKLLPLPNTISNTIVYGHPAVSDKDFSPELMQRLVKGGSDSKDLRKVKSNFSYKLKTMGYVNDKQIQQLSRMYLGSRKKGEDDETYLNRTKIAYESIDFNNLSKAHPPIKGGETPERLSRGGDRSEKNINRIPN